jgi:hypothetical protein
MAQAVTKASIAQHMYNLGWEARYFYNYATQAYREHLIGIKLITNIQTLQEMIDNWQEGFAACEDFLWDNRSWASSTKMAKLSRTNHGF